MQETVLLARTEEFGPAHVKASELVTALECRSHSASELVSVGIGR